MKMKTMIDLSDPVAASKAGYVLCVLYAPGEYAPCPSVFLSDIARGATPWAAHFTALHEAVEYADEMRHRRLVDGDARLFVRDQDGGIAWKNWT